MGHFSLKIFLKRKVENVAPLVIHEVLDELYIQVGSMENVGTDSYRAAIRKISLLDSVGLGGRTTLPVEYRDLAYLAHGIRNTVGLALDPYNV